ncbi:MAG: hypothetical protein RIK87_29705 [Fuerstiella sp.]
MGKFKPFLFGIILGAGIAVCALQFHVVQSHEGIRIIPRTPQPSLGLAFADVRNWDAETWADRPELVRALVAHGSTDLVSASVADSVVNAVKSETGTLDQLRSFLNTPAPENAAVGSEDGSGFLRIPDTGPAEEAGDDVMENLFTLPFPQDARKKSAADRLSAHSDAADKTRLVQRDLPSIDDVLSAGVGDPAPTNSTRTDSGQTNSGQTDSGRASLSTGRPEPIAAARPEFMETSPGTMSAAEETELLEGMLFGDDEPGGEADSDVEAGVFEDITSTLESRAEAALQQAASGVSREAGQAVTDSVRSMNRYIRGKATESLPAAANMFSDEFRSDFMPESVSPQNELPPALKAIRDGFDPFVE